jgi:phosphoribosylanthranilate isomerase
MKLKLKICGLREPENIQAVAALSPDYMGFIFYKKSPRVLPADFSMPKNLPNQIKKVGVFVEEPQRQVLDTVQRFQLHFVQLHGNETVAYCEMIRATGVKVIKVFSVDDDFDFGAVTPYKSVVDYFMFDTKGKNYGGNGYPFNWKKLSEYDQQIPFFLSGGLSPENVSDAQLMWNMNLHALDVNSGVEESPGLKRIDLIRKLKSTIEQWSE